MARVRNSLVALKRLQSEIIECERCPRLRKYCQQVARERKAAYREFDYWGRPVAGFGDPAARMIVVGLAPAAHGANRTGRIFTGDRSGDFLFAALHRTGFANQPNSTHRDDGLALNGVYITAAARCAPPANKPLPSEMNNCLGYLESELKLLANVRVAVTLGKIGHDQLIRALQKFGIVQRGMRFPFGHGLAYKLPKSASTGLSGIVCSYHVSQQNTFTGRLTPAMFDDVIRRADGMAASA